MTAPSHPESLQSCKHPRVRIVARDEDAEFVECELCGDVFDSEEFRDMEIGKPVRFRPNAEGFLSFVDLINLTTTDSERSD